MKKMILLIGLIIMLIFTVACSSSNNENNQKNENDVMNVNNNTIKNEEFSEDVLIGSWSWPVPIFEEGTPNISGFLNYTIKFKKSYVYFYYDEKNELVEEGTWELNIKTMKDGTYYTLILKETTEDGTSAKYYSVRYDKSTDGIELSFIKQIINDDEENPVVMAVPIIMLSRIEEE